MKTLPTEININLWTLLKKVNKTDEFWDMISEYLSDKYECAHSGYTLDDNIKIHIADIDWDVEE